MTVGVVVQLIEASTENLLNSFVSVNQAWVPSKCSVDASINTLSATHA